LPSPIPTIDANESALRVALKDQSRAIKVCQFEGKYDLRAVVTFFEEVELLFQAIGLQPYNWNIDDDSNCAGQVAQGYFGHDARAWLMAELEDAGTTISTCLGERRSPFSWIELK
jgi:hypothetical protein